MIHAMTSQIIPNLEPNSMSPVEAEPCAWNTGHRDETSVVSISCSPEILKLIFYLTSTVGVLVRRLQNSVQ